MDAGDLHFPILLFDKYGIRPIKNDVELTTTYQASLKKGEFDNAEIIDSSAIRYRVVSAQKVGDVGLFWGYSIFFSRRIKVELTIEKIADEVSADEVRQRILQTSVTGTAGRAEATSRS